MNFHPNENEREKMVAHCQFLKEQVVKTKLPKLANEYYSMDSLLSALSMEMCSLGCNFFINLPS